MDWERFFKFIKKICGQKKWKPNNLSTPDFLYYRSNGTWPFKKIKLKITFIHHDF
jgi:hypothetical protein